MKRDHDDLVSFLFPFSFFFFFFNFLLRLDLCLSKRIRPNKKQTNKHFSLRRLHTLLLNWAFHRFPPPLQGFCWLAHSYFLNFLKKQKQNKTKRKKQNWLKRGENGCRGFCIKTKTTTKTKQNKTKTPNQTKKHILQSSFFHISSETKCFFFFFFLNLA